MAEDGFETWYRAEHRKMLASLIVAAGDRGIAAEVCDEAFVRAYERWGRVSAMDSPGGWTYRTACNLLRRRMRRARIEERLLRRVDAGSSHRAPPPDWSLELWDAINRLPVRQRTAIALRHIADLDTNEIADAMRIAPGTVGSTLHAARQHLVMLLGADVVEARGEVL